MRQEQDSPPRAVVLRDALVAVGVTHVIGLPDNGSAALFDLLAQDPVLTLLNVTREGEAFAIASGLWLGGKRPAVVIQNTGLLESGDSLRGTAVRMGVPLLCLVGYRGYQKMIGHRIDPHARQPTPEVLTRSDLDSAALLTEPTLDAWGLPYYHYSKDRDAPRIAEAWDLAQRESRPVALLLTHALA
ncbi:MAG: thiamine pyrophosphate-binding protein [Rhodothermales bacterium]